IISIGFGIVITGDSSVGNRIGGNRILAGSEDKGSLSFDGWQYVKVSPTSPDPLAISTTLTIEARIYPTGPGVTPIYPPLGGTIVNKENSYELNRFADGTIWLALWNSNPGWNWINTGYVAPADTWTSLALVYDAGAGTAIVYANGQQVYSTGASG